MSTGFAERAAGVATGVLFMGAAAMKVWSPGEAVSAVAHAVSPVTVLNVTSGLVITSGLIGVEAGLGAALLCRPSRGVRHGAAALLCVLAAVLAVRFTGPSAPACGCLGSMVIERGAAGAWMDVARNLAFAAGLFLTAGGREVTGEAGVARRGGVLAGARGFTIVEVLVVVAVVALLAALLIPAVAAGRARTRVVRSLSAQQQIGAAIAGYGTDHKDYFPNFETLDGAAGPVRMRGEVVPTGYFRAHMGFWLAAVGPHDEGLINLARWPAIAGAEPMGEEERRRGLHYSTYYMSATVAADPLAFTEPIASSHPLDPTLLRGMRWSEVLWPARKGLTLDFALYRGMRDDAYVAGFCDGSVAELADASPPEPLVPQPGGGPITIVMSTRGGVRGVDR